MGKRVQFRRENVRAVPCLWVTVPRREVCMRNPQRIPMWKHGKADFLYVFF